jgi:tRNA A37 N6-isopentenylltransferase MiaA
MYSMCCYVDMVIITRKENAEKMESIRFVDVKTLFKYCPDGIYFNDT